VTGSPVTSLPTARSSTLRSSANQIFAGPTTGAAAAPTFRGLVAADIPNLAASIITSGQLAIANGGTGQATAGAAFNALSPNTTLGDITYANGANTNTRLAGNTTTTKKFLTQTGNGSVSAAPAWGTIAMSDLGSGSPSSGNFLRGDGSWQTVAASPAGSNTEVQYNSSGAFGSSANFTFASNAIDIGQGRVGEWAGGSTYAAFGHKTALNSSSNNYAVLQSSAGATFFNTASGTALSFRIANVDKFVVNDGYIGFNATANSAVALWLSPAASNKFGMIISGLASQSNPLFEWRNSSNATLGKIDENGHFNLSDGINQVFGTATGTKIGTGSTQKIGFFGVTPAVQQTGAAATAGGTYGSTEQNMLQKAYDALRTFGFLQ